MSFYPFNLSGPQFLVFYGALIVTIFLLLAIAFRVRQMAGVDAHPHLTDPYEIALLRAGPEEAVRIVMMSLIDRNLLCVDGARLVARADAPSLVRRPIEKAVVMHFRRASDDPPETVARSPLVTPHARALRSGLIARGLLADPSLLGMNPCFAPAMIAILALGLVAFLRIRASGPPFEFLLIIFMFASVAILISYSRRSTPLGRRTLRQLQALFKRLRARAGTLRAGGHTNEATLLAAVFGLNELPESSFKWLERLRARKDARSSNCGSSCGSGSGSSSCGSSSCGGGSGSGCGGGCGGD